MDLLLLTLGLSVVGIVTSLVSFGLLINLSRKFGTLVSGTDKRALDQILTDLLEHLKQSKVRQEKLQSDLKAHEDVSRNHFQRLGLVRFNPFTDTGGDQSFSLTVLDGHNTGFVISSLHSRDQTRVYAKPVTNGRGDGFELSSEEQQAIQRSQEVLTRKSRPSKKVS